MKKFVIASLLIVLGAIVGLSQRPKPTVAVNADIATFTVSGSSLQRIADKRLTFVTLHYNEISLPCVVTDSTVGGQIGSSAVSCGWTAEAIQALSAAGKQ